MCDQHLHNMAQHARDVHRHPHAHLAGGESAQTSQTISRDVLVALGLAPGEPVHERGPDRSQHTGLTDSSNNIGSTPRLATGYAASWHKDAPRREELRHLLGPSCDVSLQVALPRRVPERPCGLLRHTLVPAGLELAPGS